MHDVDLEREQKCSFSRFSVNLWLSLEKQRPVGGWVYPQSIACFFGRMLAKIEHTLLFTHGQKSSKNYHQRLFGNLKFHKVVFGWGSALNPTADGEHVMPPEIFQSDGAAALLLSTLTTIPIIFCSLCHSPMDRCTCIKPYHSERKPSKIRICKLCIAVFKYSTMTCPADDKLFIPNALSTFGISYVYESCIFTFNC